MQNRAERAQRDAARRAAEHGVPVLIQQERLARAAARRARRNARRLAEQAFGGWGR
jgi:hypothetical protein